MHIRIFPTSDQEARDVVNQIKRLYPEAKNTDADNIVEIEITLDRTCKVELIEEISKLISEIKILDFRDRIFFNTI